MFIIGLILEKVMIEPLLKLPVRQFEMSTLIITFGGFVIIEGTATGLWTGDFRTILTHYSGMSVVLGSVAIPITHISSFVIAVIMLIILTLLLTKTKIGKAIRATAQDKDAAMIVGINPKKIYLLTFAIGTASAGVAGTAFAISYTFFPALHRAWLGLVFTIVVVGGLGSIPGTFIAALILGVLNSVISYVLPTNITPLITYMILLFILYFRPTGIFGVK
jgi:branched-chain amino acid transport system permease protein